MRPSWPLPIIFGSRSDQIPIGSDQSPRSLDRARPPDREIPPDPHQDTSTSSTTRNDISHHDPDSPDENNSDDSPIIISTDSI